MSSISSIYKGYRFPKEIISFAVWIYYRLNGSLRDTVDVLDRRGIEVSHETIRQWSYKFGPIYAAGLRKRQPKRGDKWHLDELCLVRNGKKYWLWRAIDQNGYELDILVQTRRNTKAAVRFLKKLLKGLNYVPRVMITDKLRSYKAAKKKILKSVDHRTHKRLNNRIEASHQATRLREQYMRGFKKPQKAQLFLSVFGTVRNFFKIGFYKLTSEKRKQVLKQAFSLWDQVSLQAHCAQI
jgi:putative transposase